MFIRSSSLVITSVTVVITSVTKSSLTVLQVTGKMNFLISEYVLTYCFQTSITEELAIMTAKITVIQNQITKMTGSTASSSQMQSGSVAGLIFARKLLLRLEYFSNTRVRPETDFGYNEDLDRKQQCLCYGER